MTSPGSLGNDDRAGRESARRRGKARGERGQAAVEMMGMLLLIFFTLFMLIETIVVGYTLVLASRAADQAAREAALHYPEAGAANIGEQAGRDSLPAAMQDNSDIDVSFAGGQAHAVARVDVPLVVPGWASVPFTMTATSAARP